jgi:NAD+ diphosphatase
MVCPKCGLIEYPKISPVVIVAVTNGNSILLTRYANRPQTHFALVAGFVEIGETLEDTVRREVLEETGVRVKNLRYYKSQPWGFSSSLLNGFYCDLDGDDAIKVDGVELSEAVWVPRDEVPPMMMPPDKNVALTAEMMEMFRIGKNN